MFWLIKFGKMPCFENISFVPVHKAKGDSTLQHIPAELQRSKWADSTTGIPGEDTHSATLYLSSLPAPTLHSLHLLSHICVCTKFHRETFQHQVYRICPLLPPTDI